MLGGGEGGSQRKAMVHENVYQHSIHLRRP